LEFTGILLDSRSMSLSVLPVKRQKALLLLESWLSSAVWTRELADKLVGHFVRFSRLLFPLRPFASRVLAWKTAAFRASGRSPPSAELRADVVLLDAVLRQWGGSSVASSLGSFLKCGPPPRTLLFWADASPLWGFGILCLSTGEWCLSKFTARQLAAAQRRLAPSSTFLETIPLAVLMAVFPVAQCDVRVVLDCKNVAEWGIRSRTSDVPEQAALWRVVTAQQVVADCVLSAEHRPRKYLRAVDLLSRGDLEGFRAEAAARGMRVRHSPSPVPVAALQRWDSLCPIFGPPLV